MSDFSILVAGAQGQVGSELIRESKKLGISLHALSSRDLDITDSSAVESCIERLSPNLVINAAAYTAVDKAEEEIKTAFAVNCAGAEYLARSCATHNIPLLHISTDYIFDGSKKTAYTELDQASPLGVYGQSKWQGEEAVRNNLGQHIILRVAWVFGVHGNNFVKTMLRLGESHDKLRVVGDQKGGPTSAQSIAKTLLAFAQQYRESHALEWGTYHYCGGPSVSWYDFAQEIFAQSFELGLLTNQIKVEAITTAEYPTPAQRPMNSVLNSEKLKLDYDINQPDWKLDLKQVLIELNSNK